MGIFSKRTSISKKLALFLATMLSLQCVLFTGVLLFGGTLKRLDRSALNGLRDRTTVRKSVLENELIQRWSNLDRTQSLVGAQVADFLARNDMTTADLNPDNPVVSPLYQSLSESLLSLLRTNSVTGVFLVFQGDKPADRPADGSFYLQSGLCFRDMDPNTDPANNSDITVERGSSELIRPLGLAMDANWKPAFHVSADYAFYFEPLQAAMADAGASARNLGYWSPPHSLADDSVSLFSYSEPLFDAKGEPYGVLGVELSTDHLHRLLPGSELSAGSGSYLLAIQSEDGATYRAMLANGATARRVLDGSGCCYLSELADCPTIYEVGVEHTNVSGRVMASMQPLSLYGSLSPFRSDAWVLIGLVETKDLFSLSISVSMVVLGVALAMLALGVILAVFAGNLITRPIRALAQAVRHLNPNHPISLPPVHIREIDDLADSIEGLSHDVSAAASRTARIIELSGIPMAAFELTSAPGKLHYTQSLFSLLGLPEPETPLSNEELKAALDSLAPFCESHDDGQYLFRLPSKEGYRWTRLQTVSQEGGILGVLTDATAEIVEKRRLEYERDYDLLTSLLNRRAFRERIAKLERSPESLRTAAMLMLDLDNLKYLNDTYGHDCGDEYIRCAANVLRGFTILGGLAARVSGDEFYLFLSGYDDRQSIQTVINRLQTAIGDADIVLPTGQRHRLRASLGVAWYPEDSLSLSELARYADFAMYTAKRESKGGARDFNLSTYQRDAFLLYGQEELNRVLDEGAVDFAFQPIVSCADGSVLGYEALMRPRSKPLSSPLDFLRVARAQSRLHLVERLTFFRSMEAFSALFGTDGEHLIFINSISSQVLAEADWALFRDTYRGLLPQIVIEFTEGDELNAEATEFKKSVCRQDGMRLALDDYGTGYSGDAVLLSLNPSFVKVDLSIIRGIDQDKNRQTVLGSLVSLCRDLNIQVIVEGVETSEELRTVVALGADYVQGYYAGRPTLSPAVTDPAVVAEICAAAARI